MMIDGEKTPKREYTSIGIHNETIKLLDEYLERHPEYRSRLELIHEAIRMHIKRDQQDNP